MRSVDSLTYHQGRFCRSNSVAELKHIIADYPVSHACDGCLATRLLYGLNTSNLLVALSVPITLKTTFHNSFDTSLNV